MAHITWSEIDKRLSERQPLFIRNVARHKPSGAATILVINYPSSEGDRSFNIPRTNIPFNICDYVDQESLRASSSFRKIVNHGKVEVIEQAAAEALLEDPAKQQALMAAIQEADSSTIYQARANELSATKEAEASVRAEKQAEQSVGMKHMLSAMDPTLARALNLTRPDGQFQDPKLVAGNTRLQNLTARIVGGTMSGDQVVRELTLMLGDLTLNDFQSIATTSTWPLEAQVWARERLAFATKALNTTQDASR